MKETLEDLLDSFTEKYECVKEDMQKLYEEGQHKVEHLKNETKSILS
jgi:hypothetical protein